MHTLKQALLIAIVGTLCVLNSCAPKPKQAKTTLNITPSLAIADINMDGGAIVYGERTDGIGSFGKIFRPGQNVVVEMAFGIWNFSVFAYDGANGPLTGAIECSLINDVEIKSESAAVDMKIDLAQCAGAGARRVDLNLCTSAQFDSVTGATVASCDQTATGIRSWRMRILGHRLGQPNGEVLEGPCILEADYTGGSLNRRFPSGLGNTSLAPAEMVGYTTLNCSGTERVLPFRENLSRPSSQLAKSFQNTNVLNVVTDISALPVSAPTITSISPSILPTSGGETLTLNGSNFQNGATVEIDGLPCTSYTLVSSTQATCIIPSITAGSNTITFLNTNGTNTSFTVTSKTPLSLGALSPNNYGPISGGKQITVPVSSFPQATLSTPYTLGIGGIDCSTTPAISCSFGTCSGNFTCDSTPALSAGTYDVTVRDADGFITTITNAFIVDFVPIVSSVSTSVGPTAGGTTLTINGSEFQAGATVQVNSATCNTVNVVSANQITCTTGAGSPSTGNVMVTNPNGYFGISPSNFYYEDTPTVTSVSTSTGDVGGNSEVTVTGTNFAPGATVSIGGTNCLNSTYLNGTSIKCDKTPATAAGTYEVRVTNPGGTTNALASAFTFNTSSPTLSSFSPTKISTAGAENLTITGTNFVSAPTVSIAGSPCTGVTYVNATTITCTTPALGAGAKKIIVTNPDGSNIVGSINVKAPMSLGAITPSATAFDVGGANFSVAVSGVNTTDYPPPYNLQIGGTNCSSTGYTQSFGFVNGINCTGSPAMTAGTYDLTVTDADGFVSTIPSGFTIQASPALITITEADPYDYGSVTTGATQSHLFTLNNTGASTATGLGESGLAPPFSFTGGSYPGTGGTCGTTLVAAGSCDIQVTYSPAGLGLNSDTITIDYNDGYSAQQTTRDVQGTSVTPASLSYDVGVSFDYHVVPSYPADPTAPQGNYNASTNTPSLTDAGGAISEYYIVDTAGTQDLGSGPIKMKVGQVLIHDGTRWLLRNPMGKKVITITNSGGSTATSMTPTGISPPFRFSGGTYPGSGGDCGATLNAGSNCTIEVEVYSNQVAAFTQTLSMNYNDGASAQSVNVGLAAKAGEVIQISGSTTFNCALFDAGKVKCWGNGADGKLGLEAIDNIGDSPGELSASPFIDLGTNVLASQIATGDNHVCAIIQDGNLKCWGGNANGQLGLGDSTSRGNTAATMGDNLPVVPLGSIPVKELAANGEFTCVILKNANNDVKCWGANTGGQLGGGGTAKLGHTPGTTPVNNTPISLGTDPKASLTLGVAHACVFAGASGLRCWGDNAHGQLGAENTADIQDAGTTTAIDLGGMPTPLRVFSGINHTCALGTDNSVKCWGQNLYGQLGLGTTANMGDGPSEMGANLPVVPLPVGTYASLMASQYTNCALKSDTDELLCWGDGTNGQLANESTATLGDNGGEVSGLAPINLGTGLTPRYLAKDTECVVLNNGEVKCWGSDFSGRLGLGGVGDTGGAPGDMGDNLPYVNIH